MTRYPDCLRFGKLHCQKVSRGCSDPSVVAVLVAVSSVHMCCALQFIAVAMLNTSIDYKRDILILAFLCSTMQNSHRRTHNPLVRGSYPCRPTSNSHEIIALHWQAGCARQPLHGLMAQLL